MATHTFREFIQDQLAEFDKHLRQTDKVPINILEERLRGARDFAMFLFGEPTG